MADMPCSGTQQGPGWVCRVGKYRPAAEHADSGFVASSCIHGNHAHYYACHGARSTARLRTRELCIPRCLRSGRTQRGARAGGPARLTGARAPAGWHPDPGEPWLEAYPGWAAALRGLQATPAHAPAASAQALEPAAPSAALHGLRVSGARVAYSLRRLHDDVARVPGVWCDGTGARARILARAPGSTSALGGRPLLHPFM